MRLVPTPLSKAETTELKAAEGVFVHLPVASEEDRQICSCRTSPTQSVNAAYCPTPSGSISPSPCTNARTSPVWSPSDSTRRSRPDLAESFGARLGRNVLFEPIGSEEFRTSVAPLIGRAPLRSVVYGASRKGPAVRAPCGALCALRGARRVQELRTAEAGPPTYPDKEMHFILATARILDGTFRSANLLRYCPATHTPRGSAAAERSREATRSGQAGPPADRRPLKRVADGTR
jgi:hypothetical protein